MDFKNMEDRIFIIEYPNGWRRIVQASDISSNGMVCIKREWYRKNIRKPNGKILRDATEAEKKSFHH